MTLTELDRFHLARDRDWPQKERGVGYGEAEWLNRPYGDLILFFFLGELG